MFDVEFSRRVQASISFAPTTAKGANVYAMKERHTGEPQQVRWWQALDRLRGFGIRAFGYRFQVWVWAWAWK